LEATVSEQVRNESQERLAVLRQIIREGDATTQEEISEALRVKKFDVTQSTVSRDLRRIGAVKTTTPEGEISYYLPEEMQTLAPILNHDFSGLVTEIQSNESMIVIHTTPGSASLIARHIDAMRASFGVLGTIAGDDAIFIVPTSVKKISSIMKQIKAEFW
jgi:transcriptional regulator of arginine metabolism